MRCLWSRRSRSLDTTLLSTAFNNAGTAFPTDFGPPHTVSDEHWKQTTSVNLDGVFYSAKYEVAKMLELGVKDASIVNCASIFALRATPVLAGKSIVCAFAAVDTF